MLCIYEQQESMQKTLETGYTWFWSRSRQELWNKRCNKRSSSGKLFPFTAIVMMIPCLLKLFKQGQPVIQAIIVAASLMK